MTDETRTGQVATELAPAAVLVRRVVVAYSPDQGTVGRSIVLDRAAVAIGRAGHVTGPLALADGLLSRRHAELVPEGDAWRVVDAGSKNGTFTGGRRVESATLAPGSVVRVGDTVLIYDEHRLKRSDRLEPEWPPLLGRSVAMQRVRGAIAKAAPRRVAVLILGESGAGKELAAAAVHERSGRSGAFVPVNCGALPEQLIESELFGHVAGAFTGAQRAKAGLFEAADGGTLFLDEIGEMPVSLQPRLLRALSTGTIRPVGATEARPVDVRVVAATNREDLEERVAQGQFRGDLYARLAGYTLAIPPLRERREDVLPLFQHFLASAGATGGVSANAAEALLLFDWPYNVRQLEQAARRAAVEAAGEPIDLDMLPEPVAAMLSHRLQPETAAAVPIELVVARDREPDAEGLMRVMTHFGGNMARVADYFGKDRRQVYRWAERLGIDPEEFR